jgi:hypothetical protein
MDASSRDLLTSPGERAAAHTVAGTNKMPFCHISLAHLKFRWAPD